MSNHLGGTVVAAEGQSITLEFYWGKSCFKGKYPRWQCPTNVSPLLHANGLTNEKLAHELKLIDDQVNTYYGGCIKCYVVIYMLILLVSLAAIGVQFGLPMFRAPIMEVIEHFTGKGDSLGTMEMIERSLLLLGGIVGIIIFIICMTIHRQCMSKIKYKKSMQEIKEYIYGFELQNKYQLVKWVVKHTIDGVQFEIIVTPLQREKEQVLKQPEVAFSTVSI